VKQHDEGKRRNEQAGEFGVNEASQMLVPRGVSRKQKKACDAGYGCEKGQCQMDKLGERLGCHGKSTWQLAGRGGGGRQTSVDAMQSA
jgi:hypothetical protein